MNQYNLIEIILQQVVYKINAIKSECASLSKKEFPSSLALLLITLFKNFCLYSERALDKFYEKHAIDEIEETALRDLHLLNFAVNNMGADLRYISGSMVDRVPWSLVSPLQGFLDELLPREFQVQIILRPHWHYNYGISRENLIEVYRNIFNGIAKNLNLPDPDEFFSDLPDDIRSVSFPYLEKKNLLMHANFGHEIGHLIVHKIVDEKEADFIKKSQPQLEKLFSKQPGIRIDKKFEFGQKQQLAHLMDTAINMWRRGMEELLADYVGVRLFGPSALFAAFEIAINQKELQRKSWISPSSRNGFYPPWPYRIALMCEDLKESSLLEMATFENEELKSKWIGYFHFIQDTVRDFDSQKKNNELEEVVYGFIEKYRNEMKNRIQKLGIKFPNTRDLYDGIEYLYGRLKHDIPPNAVENHLVTTDLPSCIRITSACWLYKLDTILTRLKPIDSVLSMNERQKKLNRLGLKAVEYSFIQNLWNQYEPAAKR
ncbi:hypothetical protein GF406_16825 [candidate division KSB1 bacterium]|nr:hypothetical protein [candidate division KSB1 bacterium]